jgi:large subunit ribosomal protein L15
MPLHRRLPKRGFTSQNRVEYQVVNLFQLEALEDEEITLEVLAERGLIRNPKLLVKVLGTGTLTRKVSVSAHAFSKSAREQIEGSGGSVKELERA